MFILNVSLYLEKSFTATAPSSLSCSREKDEKAFSILDRMNLLSLNTGWLLFYLDQVVNASSLQFFWEVQNVRVCTWTLP